MLIKKSSLRVLIALLIMLLMSSTASASPLNPALGSGFTYQAKLTMGSAPAADQRGFSFPQNSIYVIDTYTDFIFFNDDFESYAENAYPSSFTLLYDGAGTAEQKVITTVGYEGTDSKVFRLLGVNSWASEHVVPSPSPLPAILLIDAYVKPVSGNWPGGIRLRNPSGQWGTVISDVIFNTEGNITAGGVVIDSYVAGTWYRVTMEHDIAQKTYTVYINGIKVADDCDMHPTLSPTQIEVLAGNSGTNEMYFDDLGIYTINNLFLPLIHR